jgi:glucosamine--fructose-6-phosphate aminotransferase (isomerizing)
MCGIVGAIAQRDVVSILIEGLKRLEYRGYDSAGVAVINAQQQLQRIRTQGKVKVLEEAISENYTHGGIGIAHTRWATHGKPCELNAHPHTSHEQFAIVHNGIIENFSELREQLIQQGYQFSSDTDSEVVAHLFHQAYQQYSNMLQAAQHVAGQLQGAYALGVINTQQPDRILAIRRGSPLVIGLGIGENYLASDHLALLPVTQRFIYLEEGNIAEITQQSVQIYNQQGEAIEPVIKASTLSQQSANKGKYRHFMEKEIYEQPNAVISTLEGRLSEQQVYVEAFGDQAAALFKQVQRVQIVACGTSYHAGLVARCWFEEMAGIPCQVDIASEYRYRKNIVEPNTLFVTISQSGETADTLAALRKAKQLGYCASLAICNIPESSLVRESDLAFMTRAGAEIGVASTKAFTTQLTALLLLVVTVSKQHGLPSTEEQAIIKQLKHLPTLLNQTLQLSPAIESMAQKFVDKHHTLFLGRGVHYPVALEGALKLKEISYIHAEAYAAGELKHGPLALVDSDMPVIAIAPNDQLLEKLKSNLHEVRSRGGALYVFADKATGLAAENDMYLIEMPEVSSVLTPIVYTVPLQLFAYHVAVMKGTDVDQPRNLAKSVTVE